MSKITKRALKMVNDQCKKLTYSFDSQIGLETLENYIECRKALEEKLENQWTPTRKSLPDDGEMVRISLAEYVSQGFHENNRWYDTDNDVIQREVLAWKPLDEVYREEDD